MNIPFFTPRPAPVHDPLDVVLAEVLVCANYHRERQSNGDGWTLESLSALLAEHAQGHSHHRQQLRHSLAEDKRRGAQYVHETDDAGWLRVHRVAPGESFEPTEPLPGYHPKGFVGKVLTVVGALCTLVILVIVRSYFSL